MISRVRNWAYSPFRALARQRWIRRGIRERILRFFAHPEMLPHNLEFETDFFGMTYRGNLSNLLDWNVYFYGAYEREILLLMHDLLKDRPYPVFIDIGANVGQHTLFVSRVASVIHAFEPFEPVRLELEKKLNINNIKNVFVHDFGLGDKDESKHFYAPCGANQGTGSFIEKHISTNEVTPIALRTVIGDDFFEQSLIQKIDLIKIDVEGFEKFVLLGLQRTLARFQPMVLMEYSETTQRFIPSIRHIKDMFPNGYEFFGIQTRCLRLGFLESAYYRLEKLDMVDPTNEILAVPGIVAKGSPLFRDFVKG